jgi:hypothetical protein
MPFVAKPFRAREAWLAHIVWYQTVEVAVN